jgi:two-component system, chemotaxis family, chemotaxis protein CheY
MTRVLIVDDNPDSREMLRTLLEVERYDVDVAADGEQALRMQRTAPADVVITDLFMPDKDGMETIRDLSTEFPQTKIIAMSGAANYTVDYLSLSLEFGAAKVLRKPFEATALLGALREVLGPEGTG